jgi:hypothetical protein
LDSISLTAEAYGVKVVNKNVVKARPENVGSRMVVVVVVVV